MGGPATDFFDILQKGILIIPVLIGVQIGQEMVHPAADSATSVYVAFIRHNDARTLLPGPHGRIGPGQATSHDQHIG